MHHKVLLFVCFLNLLTFCHSIDDTLKSHAFGKLVTETVVQILQDNCIISDQMFYLRAAVVATNYGNNRYIAESSGGIWKVDRHKFDEIRQHRPQLRTQITLIAQNLNINWESITWSDMSKPLLSGLGAFLYLQLITANPIPETIEEQATYYNQFYDNLSSPHTFYEKATNMSQENCPHAIRDIVFILDSSQNITQSDLTHLKTFIQDIVSKLPQDPKETQIAILGYGTNQNLVRNFNSQLEISNIENELNKLNESHGAANTGGGLKFSNENIFVTGSGMRPNSAKSVVLITSDPSLNKTTAIQQAEMLKAKGIRLFVLGVGHTTDKDVLSHIASSPSCSSFLKASRYSTLHLLKEELTKLLCAAPEILHIGENILQCGHVSTLRIPTIPSGLTVTITVNNKEQEVFGSFETSRPNKDYNDLSAIASQTHPVVFSADNNKDLILKMSDTKSCSGNFSVSINVGFPDKSCNSQEADVVFVVDSSSGVTDEEFNSMISFVRTFAGLFYIDSSKMQVGLVSYGDTYTNHFWLNDHSSSADLLQALSGVLRSQSGRRDTGKALRFVRGNAFSQIHGGRTNALQDIILITAGNSINRTETIEEAHAILKEGYRLIVIGIGQDPALQSELSMMTTDMKHMFKVDRTEALVRIRYDVAKIGCEVVKVLCVEAGIVRNCTNKDVQHVFAKPELPLPDICKTGLQIAPHPFDNTKYLMCDRSRQQLIVQCPNNEIFCFQTQLCQISCDGISPIVSSTTITTRPTPRLFTTMSATTLQLACDQDPCTPADVSQYFAGCKENIYIHCGIDGKGVVNNCDIDKIWNQAITNCVNKYVLSETGTPIKSFENPCFHQVGDVYFPFPLDASKFIHCDGYGDGFVGSCSDNTVWNQAELKCIDKLGKTTLNSIAKTTSNNIVQPTTDYATKPTSDNLIRPTLA